MRTPGPLPDPLRGVPFTVREALRSGVTPKRLDRSDLAAPFYGVRVPAAHDATIGPAELVTIAGDARWQRLERLALARAQAYAPRMPAQAVFSHASAARIHGLPLPRRLAGDLTVHIAVNDSLLRPRTRGVRAHLVPPGRQTMTVVNGMRTLSAVDTWCSMATVLTADELIVMGDGLVRRRRPLATMTELERAVQAYAGRHGAPLLRAAHALVRPRTDSPRETELRLALVRAGLPEPEINRWVLDARGRRLRLGDMLYPEQRILVEYDGAHHFEDVGQRRKDIDVLDEIVAAGWRVIRAHRGHGHDRYATVVARVRTALTERGWLR